MTNGGLLLAIFGGMAIGAGAHLADALIHWRRRLKADPPKPPDNVVQKVARCGWCLVTNRELARYCHRCGTPTELTQRNTRLLWNRRTRRWENWNVKSDGGMEMAG